MHATNFWPGRLGLVLLALWLLAGCGGGAPEPAPTSAPRPTLASSATAPAATPSPSVASGPRTPMTLEELEATRWILVRYGPPDAPRAATDGTVTANFDNMGELHGETGCNNYHLPFTLEDGVLAPAGVQQTRQACVDEGLGAQEAAYVAALGSASAVERQGEHLVITYAGGELLFRPLPPPEPTALSGTRWRLVAFDLGDMVQQALPEAQVTLQFDVGTLSGSGGCNSYGGPYTLDGASLSIQDVVSTAMLCADEQVMQQEGAFMRALGLASAYEIRDGVLLITYDGGVLQFAPLDPEAPLVPER